MCLISLSYSSDDLSLKQLPGFESIYYHVFLPLAHMNQAEDWLN